MRLNNGAAEGSAYSKGGGNHRQQQQRDIRFEISDDLLNQPQDSSDEDDDPSWTPRSKVGKNVNDLRNGRAGTPASSVHSSVRTRQSVLSDQRSRASTSTSQRSLRRRETFSQGDEPHPYGLESQHVFVKPQNGKSPSPSRTVRVEQVAYRRETTTDELVHIHQHHHGYVSQHNNTNSASQFAVTATASYKHNNDGDYLLSSDSDTSINEDQHDRGRYRRSISSAEISQFFSSTGYYLKKIVSSICSYIYLFVVGTFLFEKWCLYVKRGGENSESVGAWDADGEVREVQDVRNVRNVRNLRSRKNVHVDEREEYVDEGGVHYVRNEHYEREGESEFMSGMKDFVQNFEKLGKILLRLALVILLLFLLWIYGSYLLSALSSGTQTVLAFLYSIYSGASNGIATISYFAANSLHSSTLQAAQRTNTPNLPSTKTESVNAAAELSSQTVYMHKDSEATLAALKTTQETIDALKLQIASMELILNEHGVRLSAHDDSFKTLQEDIEKIILAMKAASTKEKSVEQIIEEVLSTPVGETAEGTPVTLKGIFSILQQKADRERISNEIEIKLRALSENIGKINDVVSEGVNEMQTEISVLTSRVQTMESIVEKQAKIEPQVDIEKLKTVILPILAAEIHESVATSCKTRNCPEGLPTGGLSIEDVELLIKRAISKYDADKTGLPDLALESAGGSILSTRCTKSSELRNSVISYWGFRLWSPPNTPRTIIQPGVVPGECWAFEGSVGDVVIKLAVPAVVTGFTMEHIPKTISRYGHIDSAPKHFQVLGLQSEHDTTEVHDYGSFTYKDNNEPLQYFPVVNASANYYPIVELKILSNHGNMRHTCLYRFRVHGAIDLTRSQNGGGAIKIKPPISEESSNIDAAKSSN